MDEGLSPPAQVQGRVGVEALLPTASHCAMPDQAFWPDRSASSADRIGVRIARLLFALVWGGAVIAFAWTLYRVLSVEEPTTLQLVFWVLSTVCFAWVSTGSIIAVLGFGSLLLSRSIDTLDLPPALPLPRTRTALLFPVYREDPSKVAVAIEAMYGEIIAATANSLFDVFILSDTQDPAERALEQCAFVELRSRCAAMQIYVRWRSPNTAKKAGNIRDWIERFGAAYPNFIILDADSVMTADVMLRLANGLESNPRAGLIQTVPRLVGGVTCFARLQQFAGCYYGQLLSAGLAAWHGTGGNYWGHNAIIRTDAFAKASGLPELSGKPPLGGHILSHDFVEAALLRRAGWEVHLAPSLEGSFEGCPPTLADLIARDRRWAQGNLQHLRLLGVHGLPLMSRVHLAMGAFAYLASPIWALTLLIGVVLALQAKYAVPTYFGAEASLFPKWPVFDARTALLLFCATVFVVHLPKILGGIWALRNSAERERNGGVPRIAAGVLLESAVSTLIAPILMVTQSAAVLSTFLGRDAGWGPQRRDNASTPIMQFVRSHRLHVFWGLIGATSCWAISPAVFAWMSPIILGLLLSPITAFATAKEVSGTLAVLLATPYERQCAAVYRT
jgi:membrane glycosyltransferase